MEEFLRFLKEYFKGLVGAEFRELFISRGDPRAGGMRERGVVWVRGLDLYISNYIGNNGELKRWNIYMGVGYLSEPGLTEPQVDKMRYDRLSFDFDSEESPQTAVIEALGFANLIHKKYGASPIVFETGFKGAHVVIPLSKPVDWEGYQLLWRHFYSLLPPATRKMADLNMLQWNRVDRVPLTYNVKENGAKFCRIIYPKGFSWSDFNWGELQPLDPEGVTVVKVETPRVAKPKPIHPVKERKWVWRVVERGLPDGRKRFMFYVLIPYLAVVGNMSDEEITEICREFVENSCRNHNKCSKVYDSWIKGAIEWVREKGFKGLGLEKFKEKNPDIRGFLEKALGE